MDSWDQVAFTVHVLTDHPGKTCGQLVCWWKPYYDERIHEEGEAGHLAAIKEMITEYEVGQ